MADIYISGDKGHNFEIYYDNDSAPTVQNVNTQQNYNQNHQDNLPPYQSIINQETPYCSDTENISNENNMNKNSNLQAEISKIIIKYILALILVVNSLIDILFQLIYWYINLYLMIDDISILAISSVYLIYTYKRKQFNTLIAILTVIIWFCGFGCKGCGLTLLNDRIHDNSIPKFLPVILFLMVVIRLFTIFFYIPITCGKY